MSGRRLDRLEEIFQAALELPAAERAHFLDAACERDTELRDEIAELLRSHDAAVDYFDGFADGLARSASGELRSASGEGVAIGAYRTVREIGRGGMGRVFLAERADGAFERQVALKLMRRGLDAPEWGRRFDRERGILARMEHPGIARFIDAGVGPDGRSYVVMEYVDGTPLHEYCDTQRLDVSARLRLFLDVCDAVAYAHRHLVVHCDLKPSNVLVDRGGRVRLLDFGIADWVAGREQDGDADEPRLLTPSYAAPEQLRGEQVSTATDVFSLGVVLYELVCGGHPFGADRRDDAPWRPPSVRAARTLRGDEDEAASARRTTPPALQRRLRGDLDAICARALAVDPTRRYASVVRFGADVRRHLQGDTVEARGGGLLYTASRTVKRHLFATTAGVAIFVFAAAFAVAAARQAARIATERDRARRVTELLIETLRAADPYEVAGDELLAAAALERAAVNAERSLQDPPALRGTLLTVVGRAAYLAGHHEQAARHFESALALREPALGPRHADVVELLRYLSRVAHARGDEPAARAYWRDACDRAATCPKAADWAAGLGPSP